MANRNLNRTPFSVTRAQADYSGIERGLRSLGMGIGGYMDRKRKDKLLKEQQEQQAKALETMFGVENGTQYLEEFGKAAPQIAQVRAQNKAAQLSMSAQDLDSLLKSKEYKDAPEPIQTLARTQAQQREEQMLQRQEQMLKMQNTASIIRDREQDNARAEQKLAMDQQAAREEAERRAEEEIVNRIAFRVAGGIDDPTAVEGATPQQQIKGAVLGQKKRKELYPGEYEEDQPLQGVARNIADLARLKNIDISEEGGVERATEEYQKLTQSTSRLTRELSDIETALANGRGTLALAQWNRLFPDNYLGNEDELKEALGIVAQAAPAAQEQQEEAGMLKSLLDKLNLSQ